MSWVTDLVFILPVAASRAKPYRERARRLWAHLQRLRRMRIPGPRRPLALPNHPSPGGDMTVADSDPAETLRAAAEKLRGFIAELRDNGGPWTVHASPSGYPQSVTNIGVPYDVCQTYTDPGHPPVTAQYIASMHPGVALALIAVFESWARIAELNGDLINRIGGMETVAVARAIFAEERWRSGR